MVWLKYLYCEVITTIDSSNVHLLIEIETIERKELQGEKFFLLLMRKNSLSFTLLINFLYILPQCVFLKNQKVVILVSIRESIFMHIHLPGKRSKSYIFILFSNLASMCYQMKSYYSIQSLSVYSTQEFSNVYNIRSSLIHNSRPSHTSLCYF